jgi:CO/xanthine dehydrogenase FAD-binding subunit
MIPDVEVIRAESIDHAVKLLSGSKGEAVPLAGGTDIIPGFQQGAQRFSTIKTLVDIGYIPELTTLTKEGNNLLIGAAITFGDLLRKQSQLKNYPLLLQAASGIGSVQIRNRATIGGNIVNNAPCADSVPPLLVYDALVKIRSVQGKQEVPLRDFLSRPYKTALKSGQLVSQIVLPASPEGYGGQFYKLGRRRGVAISRITLAVLLKTAAGRIEDIRLAAGAVTPIGIRFFDLEEEFTGSKTTPAALKRLAMELGKRILDETGLRWSTPYKLPVTQQMFYQLLAGLAGKE